MQPFKNFQKSQQSKRLAESRLALKKLTKATREWGLNRKIILELIGLSSLHQLGQWNYALDDISFTDEQLEIITHLIRIQQALSHQFERAKDIENWIKTAQPNAVTIQGKSPLKYICEHDSCLTAVRTLCDLLTQKQNSGVIFDTAPTRPVY